MASQKAFRGSLYLSLPRAGIMGMSHSVWIYMGVGMKLGFPSLSGQHFTMLSYFPSPHICKMKYHFSKLTNQDKMEKRLPRY